MPHQIRFIETKAILLVVAEGPYTFEDTPPVFEDTRRGLELHPEAGILLDVRKAEYTPSASDIRHFVTRHEDLTRASRNPFAMVTSSGVNFGMAMMMCTLIDVSGGTSQAFTKVEEAERWLLDELHQRSSSPRS